MSGRPQGREPRAGRTWVLDQDVDDEPVADVGIHGGPDRFGERLLRCHRGEQIDVLRRPIEQAVSLDGIASREREPVAREGGQADTGEPIVERVHRYVGGSGRSGQVGETVLPRLANNNGQEQSAPVRAQQGLVEQAGEVLDGCGLDEDTLIEDNSVGIVVQVVLGASRPAHGGRQPDHTAYRSREVGKRARDSVRSPLRVPDGVHDSSMT
jgi:hypothetical protein